MTFYKQIAKHYNKIFQVEDEQIKFIQHHIGEAPKTVLDIACGDGGHAVELAKRGYIVTALDSTEEMISSAREKADLQGVEIGVLTCKMDEMNQYITGNFEAMMCLGNSVVHLDTEERVLEFLKQLKAILTNEGKAIIQIMNYDRVIGKNILQLPTIEDKGEEIRFERSYEKNDKGDKILFHTRLHVKDEVIVNSIELLPLMSEQFKKLIQEAGLMLQKEYGGYDGSGFDKESSYHYIVILTK